MHELGEVRSIRQWRLYSREWYKDCWNLGLAAVWRKVTINPAKALDWTSCITIAKTICVDGEWTTDTRKEFS
jgi:hypothetical protein